MKYEWYQGTTLLASDPDIQKLLETIKKSSTLPPNEKTMFPALRDKGEFTYCGGVFTIKKISN